MKILAFDSTARSASVALLEDERLLALYNIDNGLTHSELLLPMAEEILRSLHVDISEVGLFAAAVGPGSFTGVRIGASLVKGLAFGRDIPCAAVSTIEALAENLRGTAGYIIPCMDARRAQVYTATFLSDGNEMKRLSEDRAISLAQLAEELRPLRAPIYLVGDGYEVAYRALTAAGITLASTPPLAIPQSAYSIGLVALRQHAEGKTVTDREISATYLRVPQAERERLERLGKQ